MRLGILCSTNLYHPQRPAGRFTPRLERLLSVITDIENETYLIRPGELFDNHVIGHFYINGKWTSKEMPYPDVVYSRLPNRKSDNKANDIKADLCKRGIPVFNSGFFNKSTMYNILKGHEAISLTAPYSKSTLEQLMNEHNELYIKPISGSYGNGLIKIDGLTTKTPEGTSKTHQDKSTLIKSLGELEKYLIQVAVPGARIDNKILDFRVVTQRNRNGNWVVTICAAKLAKKGHITPHIQLGGKLLPADEALKEINRYWRKTKENLLDTCLELSEIIGSYYDDAVGEIGFDMQIDESGKPWMIEANSRPGQAVYIDTQFESEVEAACQMIYEYAYYLYQKRS